MSGDRWWYVFFGLTVVVLAVLDGVTYAPSEGQRIGAWVTLAAMFLAFVTIGRQALRAKRFVLPFSLILIIGSGIAVACSPNMAVIQAISFPLLWVIVEKTRRAVIASIALALAVALGFLVSLGWTADNLAQTAVIQGISLVGSLALGLWISRISELSSERQRLLDELTATQLALAAANRDSGATGERERLAREIHDTIAQSLTGVVMLSQRAQRELAAGDLSQLAAQLGILEESARDALVETRSLVAASAPVELGGGIGPALDRLGARFTRETGIRVEVTVRGEVDLERDTEVVLLRCAQEALANIRKHSGAQTATVRLKLEPSTAQLTVSDDGSGFAAGRSDGGFGLPGMRDRLALVDGTLDIRSTPESGTVLGITLPIGVTA